MALTVEDGTGLSDADSYRSASEFAAWCEKQNLDIAAYSDEAIDAALRAAFDYINTKWRYKGVRLVSSQAGEFPRSGCIDWSGYEVSGVPTRVKDAQSYLAYKGLTEDILADQERGGGGIVSESVGPISTTYAPGTSQDKDFTRASGLLSQYVRKGDEPAIPYATSMAVENGQFRVGQFDNPEVATDDAAE